LAVLGRLRAEPLIIRQTGTAPSQVITDGGSPREWQHTVAEADQS